MGELSRNGSAVMINVRENGKDKIYKNMVDVIWRPQNYKLEVSAGHSWSRAPHSVGNAVKGEIRN